MIQSAAAMKVLLVCGVTTAAVLHVLLQFGMNQAAAEGCIMTRRSHLVMTPTHEAISQ